MKDQATARVKNAQMVSISATGSGDAGVSRISIAAGQKYRLRPVTPGEATSRAFAARPGEGGGHAKFLPGSDCSAQR